MKKKWIFDSRTGGICHHRKLNLLMFFLFFTVITNAKNSHTLTKLAFTVPTQQTSIAAAIDQIERASSYRIYYQESLLNTNRKISLKSGDTIEQIMSLITKGTNLSYRINKNDIIIQSKEKKTIKGKIIDEKGNPIPGATVIISGTNNGTVTDIDGKFSLLADLSDQLDISFLGYNKLELKASEISSKPLVLRQKAVGLNEVVAIGYGTQRKGDVTSAVVSVKSDDFLSGKMDDATELIKGKVAGLSVINSSGDPNSTSTIRLRGITSIEGDVTPLILIDGIPGSISDVAPENIEAINVLKDASSAAIYGTRGANGVIIITTKSGKRNQQMKVTYSGYVSTSDFTKTADFMDAQDIRDGLTQYSDDGYETDWLDAITRTAYTMNHSVSLNGGSEKTTYSANFAYITENGIIKKSNKKEYKMQFDIAHYLFNDRVRLHFNLLKAIHTNTANTTTADGITNIYRQAVIHNPTSPIYEDDGSYYEEFGRYQYYNPVELLNEYVGDTENDWARMSGSIMLEPIKNWKTNLQLATYREEDSNSIYTTSDYYLSYTTGYDGSATKSEDNTKKNYLDITSSYKATMGQHRFSALVGYDYNYEEYDGFSAYNADFPTDAYLYNNLSVGSLLTDGNASMSSYKNDNKLIAFFGRLTYSYANKYNLLVSMRHEGSSRFGENHKWGNFPSASAGWTITNEPFLQSEKWLNNLKLRVGYGLTGREPEDNYLSLSMYDYGSYYVDEDGNWTTALYVTQNTNKDLKWEKTAELNVGLDFSMFDSRFSGSVDVYNKKTSDLLYEYSVPLPPNLYSTTLANVGAYRNKGIEIMVNVIPIQKKKFKWSTTITASHNKNKLLNLSNDLYETSDYIDNAYAGDPISVPTHRIEVGKSIGNFWGLKSVGVTDDGVWLVEDPSTGESVEYSTSLNSDDYRQYLGNGIPKVNLSWSNSFDYKNFNLSFQMNSQLGFKILNEQRMFYQNNSIAYNRLKSAAEPVYDTAVLSSSQAQAFVSYYIENGDFLKLNNVSLSYRLNAQKISNYIKSAKIYVSGQNLFCITGYKGLDPELSNSDFFTSGNDPRDKYPTLRTFTFGINVTF